MLLGFYGFMQHVHVSRRPWGCHVTAFVLYEGKLRAEVATMGCGCASNGNAVPLNPLLTAAELIQATLLASVGAAEAV